MPIQEQNIVFLQSQVMDDVPEGGGAATGIVIPDGVMNNVFEDISDLDRAYGRFNLRKLFLAVQTRSNDLFGGAKTLITALPADPALSYTLFATDDPFDTRADAANRVAAYLYKGPKWHGALNENHIAGMRAISVLQRVDTALPPVGKTLCLVEDEGLSSEKEQYVRITKVAAVETEFVDDSGSFFLWVVQMDLSDALRFDFTGHVATRTNQYSGATQIRNTTVADATRYYSSRPLAVAGAIGDGSVQVDTLFTQLAPSAQVETPLVNQILTNAKSPLLATRSSGLSYTVSASFAPNGRFFLETGAVPGSITLTMGGYPITESGDGVARNRDGVTVGAWDYVSGQCAFNSAMITASGSVTVSYIPAVAFNQQAHTLARTVTAENRRLNWIETLVPIPAAGTLELTYQALGNRYALADDGTGALRGSDATFGAGVISYLTGAMNVTLGALPDVGSQIQITWGSGVHTAILGGESFTAEMTLGGSGLIGPPQDVSFSWVVGGVAQTATGNVNGAISGDGATGRIYNNSDGQYFIRFAAMPDPGTELTVTRNNPTVGRIIATPTVTLAGAVATLTLSSLPIRPGGVSLHYTMVRISPLASGAGTQETEYSYWLIDDGIGGLYRSGGAAVGTINYTTGAVSFTALHSYTYRVWDSVAGAWTEETATETWSPWNADLIASYYVTTATFTQVIASVPIPAVNLGLLDWPNRRIVPGSLRLRWGSLAYVDRNGTLYHSINPATGAGTAAGAINYAAGQVTINDWTSNADSASLVLDAALAQYGEFSVIESSFQTAQAPVKPEALSVTALDLNGTPIIGVADADGVIAGDAMRGAVNYEFGAAWVEFGALAGEPAVWTPIAVDPATIRYNAVAYTYLPLDADILGIDAVRLPSDGRVPIFQPGDAVMILHADTTTGTPAQVGGTGPYRLSCGRTRLAYIKVVDANGAALPEEYTLDRAAGVLSWTSIAGLATPLTVTHTVGDLRLLTDAQINGELALSRPLTHDYPAEESLVAACLIHGDRRARVSAVWDQSSWSGLWSDEPGSAATATLNTIDYPITVTNEGADTDRWLLRWLTTTTVELISEKRGLVWSGSYPAYTSGTPVDIAPINPRTRDENGLNGTPYLTIPQRANGGGWSAGNVVRINTVGALVPFWIARAVRPSDEPDGDGADGCELYTLGNIDRP